MPTTETKLSTAIAFYARIGIHGTVGQLSVSTGRLGLRRGDMVLARTARGLERGEIVSPADRVDGVKSNDDGRILRKFSPEDALLWRQLAQGADLACVDCQRWLEEFGAGEVLLDVEPLMDGRTLYFHFLGEISERLQDHVNELAKLYEKTVRQSEFAKLLETGCGPNCGTSEGSGCGTSGGCATCVVASACQVK